LGVEDGPRDLVKRGGLGAAARPDKGGEEAAPLDPPLLQLQRNRAAGRCTGDHQTAMARVVRTATDGLGDLAGEALRDRRQGIDGEGRRRGGAAEGEDGRPGAVITAGGRVLQRHHGALFTSHRYRGAPGPVNAGLPSTGGLVASACVPEPGGVSWPLLRW